MRDPGSGEKIRYCTLETALEFTPHAILFDASTKTRRRIRDPDLVYGWTGLNK